MTPKPTAKRVGPGVLMTPAGQDREPGMSAGGQDDVLHVHFKASGHTYRVHAGTRRQALVDALAKLGTATGLSYIKNLMTVLAIVLGPDVPPASLAPLFALLPPAAVKFNWDLARGALAACVAVLRCAEMGTLQMEQWLDEEIRRRALDFTTVEAVQLFYECSKEKAKISKATLGSFHTFRPEPSTSLTEAVAKEQVAQTLDKVVMMKAGRPLTRPRRRGCQAIAHAGGLIGRYRRSASRSRCQRDRDPMG